MRIIALGIAVVLAVAAAAPGHAQTVALQGQVNSAEEGAMEGVLVSAKEDGATITVTVATDATGHYSFPAGRLAPGAYALKIRAAGYDLDGMATAQVAAGAPATVDLKLKKTRNLAAQLANAEWIQSAPGTEEQKSVFLNCISCHTVERIFRSTHDAAEFVQVMTRMAGYAPGSMPTHPQRRISAPEAAHPERFQQAASYLASINLSTVPQWDYPLKTLPRPTGRATRAIVTEYDLPRHDAMPHDVVLDPDGMAWYSDFGSQYIGRLDPKTGAVEDFEVPTLKPNFPKGLLDLEFDRDNNLWMGMMLQGGIAKFDRTTKTFQTFALPAAINGDGAQQAMVVPYRSSVDGKVWMNNVGLHGVHRVTLASDSFDTIEPFKDLPKNRAHDVYGIFADSQNNLYASDFGDNRDAQMVRIDAKTGNVTFYPIPTPYARPRRGRMDAQDRLWVAEYRGDKVAMFDTKAEKFQEWPTPAGTWPYDVITDRNGEIWTAGMTNDRVVRIDPNSGVTTAYLLPHTTNVRRVVVDNSTTPPTFWTGGHHNATIIKLEPLD